MTTSPRRGLSLLEVIIAAAILAVLSGVITQSLVTGTAASRSIDATNELAGSTARAVQGIANKLRSCDYNKIYLGNTSWTGTSGGTTLCSFKICTDLTVAGPTYGEVFLVTYDQTAGTVTGTVQDVATLATKSSQVLARDVAPNGFIITDVSNTNQVDDNRVRIDLTCYVEDAAAPTVTCTECSQALGTAHVATCSQRASSATVQPWVVGGRSISNAWSRKTSTIVFLRSTLFAGLNLTGGTSTVTTTTPTSSSGSTSGGTTGGTTSGGTTTGGTTSGGTTSGGSTSGGTTTTPTPTVNNTPFITGSNTSTSKGNQIANGTVGMPLGATASLNYGSFSVTAGLGVEISKINGPTSSTPTSWSVTGKINSKAAASDRYIEVNIKNSDGTAAPTCRIVF